MTTMITTARATRRGIALLTAAILAVFGVLMVSSSLANGEDRALTVSIAPVNLDGPAISDIDVTLTNISGEPVSDVTVDVTGPINWTLYPATHTLDGALAAGASTVLISEIHVPTNPTTHATRTFRATVSYLTDAGVREVATGTRVQQTQELQAQTLAEARSVVATTTLGTVALGDYDGEGNSFSRERLAELGVTPGAELEVEGATFTWPDVPAGEPDAVASRGQLISLEGSGTQLAVLGSGLGAGGISGEFTVNYTDDTTASGTIGFGNWFSATPSFGERVAYAMDGRNTPAGYANAQYRYGVYVATIDIDPTKTVESVLLPQAGNLRIFDMAIVGEGAEPSTSPSPSPSPSPSTSPSATHSASPSPSPSASPSGSPSPSPSASPSTSPSASPSAKPSVKPSPSVTTSQRPPFQRAAPYTLAGAHFINGRSWSTSCEAYSQTERCRTEIWATTVSLEDGRFVMKKGWAFNNLTYLPFMAREQWRANPLGHTTAWTAVDGRQWRTECDTAASGGNGCRSYTMTTVYAATPAPGGGYVFSQKNEWVFNNIVMFKR